MVREAYFKTYWIWNIVYHYKGYREASGVRKYKAAQPPVVSYTSQAWKWFSLELSECGVKSLHLSLRKQNKQF